MRRRGRIERPLLEPVYHDVPCAECGHLGREHRAELPSPCGNGWVEGAIEAAMQAATERGECAVKAAAEGFGAARAAGASQCEGYVPPVRH